MNGGSGLALAKETDYGPDKQLIDPVTREIIDQQQLAEQLSAQAKKQRLSLVGPGGLLRDSS